MEIKATLQKPYTEEEKIEFIVEQNHNQGLLIEETETELQALGYTEEELHQQETERIAMLNLTAADVERGIYKAKRMDFDDIVDYLKVYPQEGVDIKALKIELRANHFYRGNPYVNAIGALLGFTKEQLDKFFEDGDYTHLLNVNNSEPTDEENSIVEDVTGGEDVNNSESEVNNAT
jgi:hypothetical protein